MDLILSLLSPDEQAEALQAIRNRPRRYLLHKEIRVPVYWLNVQYWTHRRNLKKAVYYYIGTLNYADEEFFDFNYDQLEESLSRVHGGHFDHAKVLAAEKMGELILDETAACKEATQILDLCKKDSEGGRLLEKLRQQNPHRILVERMCFPVYTIQYSFTSKRGNLKTGIKYLIGAKNYDEASQRLLNFIGDFNKRHPYKAMLNADILNCYSVGVLTTA